jgi:SAM-dependent methyltransferase
MTCKLCGSATLTVMAHTARCRSCGALLYWPYPSPDELADMTYDSSFSRRWYADSAYLNHINFTNMLRFAVPQRPTTNGLSVLDFGGGGGQFALVCKSHLPECDVSITDIADDALLDEWRPLNRQIKYALFEADTTTFDLIFLNDVFEHLGDPTGTLKLLAGKLKPGGKVFIDTPRQFWLYPVLRTLSPRLYKKLLRGTVSKAHLQLWSKAAFDRVVGTAGLRILKYTILSEYTMPADYYLNNMGVRNPIVRTAGRLFYKTSRYIARNKIMCLLERAG